MYLPISYRKDKNYYQVFLEEFKHVDKEKKTSRFIIDEI